MSEDLRDSFPAFCRSLGVSLWPHQEELAASTAFTNTAACARRTGKTTTCELLACWEAMRTRNTLVLIISATQDASRRMTESIGQRLTRNPLTRGAVVQDDATRVKLTNGSQIISLSASARQIRGYGDCKLVIVDEAGMVPGDLYSAIWPVALDQRAQGSRLLLVGSPWGSEDHFFRRSFDLGMAGDPDHASFSWPFSVNPGLDKEYLLRQKDRIAPREYAAEVLGEWAEASGALFSRELLDAQTADVDIPAMTELLRPAEPLLGFDHGVSYDRSAVTAIYRLPDGGLNPDAQPMARFIALPWSWPSGTALSKTVKDVASIPARAYCITTETNGVGSGPSQQIAELLRSEGREPRYWNMCATTSAKKTSAYGCLLGLLESGALIIPQQAVELRRQMAGLRFAVGERGFTHIGAEQASLHDDVSDSGALASCPYSVKGSPRIHTQLQALATTAAVPDADLLPLDSDVVETGAGLKVYRRPALQSVASTDFILPAGVSQQVPPPPVDEVGRFRIHQSRKAT